MNQNDVKMVQESWSRVEDIGPVAVELFQRNLLDNRPWLTAPYTGYVDDWKTMVLQTFGQALKGMHALDTHSSLLMQIGRVNASCGVQSHHYPCFEVALLQTLGRLLGAEFSSPLKEAWTAVLGTMRRLMLAGANGTPLTAIAVRQHAGDRRRQLRRAALDLGGHRGHHRRAGPEKNRRFHHPQVT
jgi:hemoglobin-like flavoprotein